MQEAVVAPLPYCCSLGSRESALPYCCGLGSRGSALSVNRIRKFPLPLLLQSKIRSERDYHAEEMLSLIKHFFKDISDIYDIQLKKYISRYLDLICFDGASKIDGGNDLNEAGTNLARWRV
jgi:hypothetical protein